MMASFEEKNIDGIADGSIQFDINWSAQKKLEWKQSQGQVKRLILDSLSDTLSHHVVGKTTGTAMWKALCGYYNGILNDPSTTQRKMQLQTALRTAKYVMGTDMAKHLNDLATIRAQLNALNYNVEDSEMMEAMLNSLPDKEYKQFKMALEYSITNISADAVKAAILREDAKLTGGILNTLVSKTKDVKIKEEETPSSIAGAMKGRGRGRGRRPFTNQRTRKDNDFDEAPSCGACGKRGHTSENCYWIFDKYKEEYGKTHPNDRRSKSRRKTKSGRLP